ncbi:capsular polysaccharide synthesis protein [Lacimicrobium sp. SS2-24]|uniref:capsular polysaccharide synthesis protein n=1 Tax=Lacimicrobium sp. SS2-24 TaxID=2005569 RepID=UPI001439A985|nr:capsular polysaccharide synthesis protein [Lacimicrobium sp. SS2-24]
MSKWILPDVLKDQTVDFSDNTIWFFWDEGLQNAPDLIKISYDNWKTMNPDRHLILLTRDNIEQQIGLNIESFFNPASAQLGMAGKTDLLRLYLLYHWGGVWVDATTFCLKPLSQWLTPQSKNLFFSFAQPPSSPDRQLVSWFLAAPPKNPVVEQLLSEAYSYIFKEREQNIAIGPITTADADNFPELVSREGTGFQYLNIQESRGTVPYFWLFYLFNEVVKNSSLKHSLHNENTMTEKYSQPSSSFNDFLKSYVSKQTYRDNLTIYRDRLIYLKENRMISEASRAIVNKALKHIDN